MTPYATIGNIQLRLLWLIYDKPDGITARQLVEELKKRGWCEPWLEPADLGLSPDDLIKRPDSPPPSG